MPTDSPALEALRAGLTAVGAIPGSPVTTEQRAEIRESVRAAVDELRARQYTPEKALVAVKQAVEAAGIAPIGRHDYGAPQPGGLSALLSDVSRWCIERYFGVEARS